VSASDNPEDHAMPLLEHLVELRRRLFYSALAFILAFLVCYFFAPQIYGFLVEPLAKVLAEKGGERRMIFTALTEAFFTYVKVAAYAALYISFPVLAGQIWAFVAPGLYKQEKRAFLPFLIATPVLFTMGAALVYYVVLPMTWKFFVGFETSAGDSGGLPIQLEAKVSEYLSLILTMILAFGVAFQMPVLLTLLAKVGMISSETLRSKRRYAIVLNFIIAGVLTPPDLMSQLSLALPLLVLYELSILSCRLVERQRAEAEAAEEAELKAASQSAAASSSAAPASDVATSPDPVAPAVAEANEVEETDFNLPHR